MHFCELKVGDAIFKISPVLKLSTFKNAYSDNRFPILKVLINRIKGYLFGDIYIQIIHALSR